MNPVRKGVLYSILAFTLWGLLPVYWKALGFMPAYEVLAHRMVWAFVFYLALLIYKRKGETARQTLRSKKSVRILLLTGVLIGSNWFTYIYAIQAGFLLDASLGYFVTPLLNIALGMLILGESLGALGWAAVGFAGLGITQIATIGDHFPWITLILASTFGVYGLIRKLVHTDVIVASTIETGLVAVPALIYLLKWGKSIEPGFLSFPMLLFVMLSGILTGLPLLWFAAGARQLRLSTIGFLQYLSPTFQFLLAVYAYNEPLSSARVIGFACVWLGITLYTYESLRSSSKPTFGTQDPDS